MPKSRAFSGLSPRPVHSSPDTIDDGYHIPVGCILRLPHKDQIGRHSVSADIDDGCFGHPVVVLFVDPVQKKAAILTVSSPISKLAKISDIQSRLTLEAYILWWQRP